MKPTALLTLALLAAGPLLAADADPKADVAAAVKKLGEAANYSWTTTIESAGAGGGGQGGGRGFRPGPVQGKAQKDGLTWISMSRGDSNTTEAVMKGGKSVIKTDEGWKTSEELRSAADAGGQAGGRGRGRFGRIFENYKTPAVQAQELTGKTKELKKVEEAYAADLTEEAVKEQLSFGGRRRDGSEAPSPTNAKGTVKFWVKDGALSKYQLHVQGTMQFNENEINIDRTTTVEIKDVGSTKLDIPDEVKTKVSS